jgi:metallo-beta-lactamase family protein
MCTAGRILHHFKHGLWKSNTHVLIVGYQAYGSLGRLLVEGKKKVKIFGETIAVKAKIHTMNGVSAHAGQKDLLDWFDCVAHSRPRLILTHGETKPRETLAALIREKHDIDAHLPIHREVMEW